MLALPGFYQEWKQPNISVVGTHMFQPVICIRVTEKRRQDGTHLCTKRSWPRKSCSYCVNTHQLWKCALYVIDLIYYGCALLNLMKALSQMCWFSKQRLQARKSCQNSTSTCYSWKVFIHFISHTLEKKGRKKTCQHISNVVNFDLCM